MPDRDQDEARARGWHRSGRPATSPAPAARSERPAQPMADQAGRRAAVSAGSIDVGQPIGHGPGERRDRQEGGQQDDGGRSPRKTKRQLSCSAMNPLIAGPMTPGTTQAVDRTANIRGRRRCGQGPADRHVGDRRDPPGAEALEQAAADEDGHRRGQPADQQADREQPKPEGRTAGRGRPGRSGRPGPRSRPGRPGRRR